MQIPQPENVVSHFFWISLPIILTVLLSQFLSQRANKKRGQEKDNRLAILLENYRLHDHGECKSEDSEGPLHAQNVRYPRVMVDGK